MVFSGMSPDQIDAAANQLRIQANELESIRSRVTSLVNEASAHWNGRDLQSFRATWYNSYQTKLSSAIGRLDVMASQLVQQATQQRETSSATGIGGINGLSLIGTSSKPKNADGRLDMPQPLTGPVDTSDAAMIPGHVQQGDAGDCWYLAALNSIASTQAGRDFLRQNMVWDPDRNGYIVTLYNIWGYNSLGQEVKVFVDTTYSDGTNGGNSWESVYEAALVQYVCGWTRGINLGFGALAFSVLTGSTTTVLPQNVDKLREALDNGGFATAGSNPDWPWKDSNIQVRAPVEDRYGVWTTEDIEIVHYHEYSIERVDSDGNVYLRNPWGPGNSVDDGKLIKLTSQQFYDYFFAQSTGSLK